MGSNGEPVMFQSSVQWWTPGALLWERLDNDGLLSYKAELGEIVRSMAPPDSVVATDLERGIGQALGDRRLESEGESGNPAVVDEDAGFLPMVLLQDRGLSPEIPLPSYWDSAPPLLPLDVERPIPSVRGSVSPRAELPSIAVLEELTDGIPSEYEDPHAGHASLQAAMRAAIRRRPRGPREPPLEFSDAEPERRDSGEEEVDELDETEVESDLPRPLRVGPPQIRRPREPDHPEYYSDGEGSLVSKGSSPVSGSEYVPATSGEEELVGEGERTVSPAPRLPTGRAGVLLQSRDLVKWVPQDKKSVRKSADSDSPWKMVVVLPTRELLEVRNIERRGDVRCPYCFLKCNG